MKSISVSSQIEGDKDIEDCYNVEYHGNTKDLLRGVSKADPRLVGLRRIFRFRVNEWRKTLHVFLEGLEELTY
jgi:hypothetical protein